MSAEFSTIDTAFHSNNMKFTLKTDYLPQEHIRNVRKKW